MHRNVFRLEKLALQLVEQAVRVEQPLRRGPALHPAATRYRVLSVDQVSRLT